MWWRSAVNLSFFLSFATFRMRASACDAAARFCTRSVLCWLAFPLASALRSTGSAAVGTALFVGFPATMAESDFSRPCIIGFGSSPSRCGPAAVAERSVVRSPGSRARSVRACQCLRPRRAVWASRYRAHPYCLPSAERRRRPGRWYFRGSMAGLRAPLSTLRCCPRGQPRMTRGRCGSLLLHRDGLAPSTPCRPPGALRSASKSDRWITSSARARSVGGTSRPSALAVLRLIVRQLFTLRPRTRHTRASRSLDGPLADPDTLPAPRSRHPTPARDPGADKERCGCKGEAVKPMEPMEPCKAEATRPDEGTSSDETVRSNEGARSDERTPSDEGTCSDESAAHADAGSMEATATPKAAAEAAHASIRGRRRRHCTNECNGRGANHDLTPHDLSPVPFLGPCRKVAPVKKRTLGSDVQRHKNFS